MRGTYHRPRLTDNLPSDRRLAQRLNGFQLRNREPELSSLAAGATGTASRERPSPKGGDIRHESRSIEQTFGLKPKKRTV